LFLFLLSCAGNTPPRSVPEQGRAGPGLVNVGLCFDWGRVGRCRVRSVRLCATPSPAPRTNRGGRSSSLLSTGKKDDEAGMTFTVRGFLPAACLFHPTPPFSRLFRLPPCLRCLLVRLGVSGARRTHPAGPSTLFTTRTSPRARKEGGSGTVVMGAAELAAAVCAFHPERTRTGHRNFLEDDRFRVRDWLIRKIAILLSRAPAARAGMMSPREEPPRHGRPCCCCCCCRLVVPPMHKTSTSFSICGSVAPADGAPISGGTEPQLRQQLQLQMQLLLLLLLQRHGHRRMLRLRRHHHHHVEPPWLLSPPAGLAAGRRRRRRRHRAERRGDPRARAFKGSQGSSPWSLLCDKWGVPSACLSGRPCLMPFERPHGNVPPELLASLPPPPLPSWGTTATTTA
jgi:hypothetical protein